MPSTRCCRALGENSDGVRKNTDRHTREGSRPSADAVDGVPGSRGALGQLSTARRASEPEKGGSESEAVDKSRRARLAWEEVRAEPATEESAEAPHRTVARVGWIPAVRDLC